MSVFEIVFLILDAHDDPSAVPPFLDSVVSLCCQIKNDWYRVYLIRRICSLHGVEYVQKLLTQEGFKWLFPQEILESVGFSLINFIILA